MDLDQLIKGCKKNQRKAQKEFYEYFFPYAMKICLRYSSSEEDALEVVNDGFLKIFKSLNKLKKNSAVKGWISSIMVNSSIDHYRKNVKHKSSSFDNENEENFSVNSEVLERMSSEEILEMVMELPYPHRVIFNLYVIEGYSHKEISEKLSLGESTSRSYLTRANGMLRERLVKIQIPQS
ncbi:MAG: sigma-70 family RNA polymerase sigma factor [Bacteroidota bacterium]